MVVHKPNFFGYLIDNMVPGVNVVELFTVRCAYNLEKVQKKMSIFQRERAGSFKKYIKALGHNAQSSTL